jgi:transcription initiation factor TFIIIB Brf1 subunit/transcription initiation factor TFIIB
MSGPPVSLDEKAVRKILARAVEIEESQRGALTEAHVRDIARDLSIPDHVIEQALAEYRGADRQDAMRAHRLPRWLRPAAFVGVATIVLLAITFFMRLFPA